MLWILAILAALCIAVAYYCFRLCFYSSPKRNDDPYAPMVGEQYEQVLDNILSSTRIMEKSVGQDVFITSFDGLKLQGRYYHTRDGAPVQIMFHGYRSHPWRDCGGGFMLARKMGFNVLVTEQRSHIRSGGKVITFGILERLDCMQWAEYAAGRFGDIPIVLSGLSMGAATVLMAAELPLPSNVCAIMADCPYDSPGNIIRKVCRDRKMPDRLCYPFIRLGARLFGGFSLEKASAELAVKNTQIPILLLHGEDDRFVPCSMSQNIYACCTGTAQLHTFPEAGHGLSYMVDPLRYEAAVVQFLWEQNALRPFLEGCQYVKETLENETSLPEAN